MTHGPSCPANYGAGKAEDMFSAHLVVLMEKYRQQQQMLQATGDYKQAEYVEGIIFGIRASLDMYTQHQTIDKNTASTPMLGEVRALILEGPSEGNN